MPALVPLYSPVRCWGRTHAMVASALILAALAVALLAVRKPEAGLLVWIALFPVQFDTVRHVGLRFAPADVVLAGLTIAALVRRLRCRTLAPGPDGALLAAMALMLWLVMSSTTTLLSMGRIPDYVVFNKLLGLASLIASYWMVSATLQSTHRIGHALRWYCAIGSIWNLIGLAAYAGWRWGGIGSPMVFAPVEEDRLRGLLVDPNAYGGFLVSVLLVQLCLLARSSADERTRPAVLNSALLILGLVLAYSRSAWLAMFCGASLLVVHLSREERRRLAGPGLAFGVGAVLLMLLSSRSSLSQGWELALRSQPVDARLELVYVALDAFASSPVWGIGVGGFTALPESQGYIIHSTYLWLLTETGLVGLLLLGYMLVRVYLLARAAGRSADRHTRLAGLASITSLGAWLGLMVGIEALYQRHYWFLFAALGAVCWAQRGQHAVPCREPD